MRMTGGERAWKGVHGKSGRVFSGSLVSLLPAFVCLHDTVPAGYLTIRPGGTPREGCLAWDQRTGEDGGT